LTAPHQSLNPDVLVPRTLEAIQQDFTLDRVMMLIIDPKRRCLVVSHCFPNTISAIESKFLEIDISSISGLFLECLREKKPVIINSQIEKNNPLLKQFRVAEYFSAPVLHKQRLLGILYADNVISKKVLNPGLLSEIAPVAFQMGIALVNAKQYEMEKKQAQLDPLTQLYNKRMVNQVLHETFLQHTSVLSKIAVGFIDIDKFKMVNDVCGHQLGDEALIIVAEIMVNLTRPGDFIGRYGGEEFVFLLRNTDETGAFGYAERIRKEIEKKGKQLRDKFHHHELTVSIGLAIYHRHFESYADMIKIADQAMYDAKRKGRNQVVMINNATEYQEDSLNQRVINASKPSVF
jgi:two-component system, cell cycle response regulator